jgi:hypothetical protein
MGDCTDTAKRERGGERLMACATFLLLGRFRSIRLADGATQHVWL